MDHISYSQISSYLRCGEAYRRRYIEKEIIPPGIALVRGISIHKGAEEQNRFKLATREDKPKKEVLEVISDSFDTSLKDGIRLTKEEKSRKAKVIGQAKDDTIKLGELFCDQMAPTVMPEKVEHSFVVPLNDDIELRGRIDLIDINGALRDLKTSGKKKAQTEADLTDQLTAYALGYEYVFEKPPPKIILDVLVNNKTPNYQLLSTTRTHNDIDIFFRRMQTVLEGIRKGIFLPADPTSWICDPRYCGYAYTCPYCKIR